MTEDEARAKWCPFARTKTLNFSSENSGVSAANRDFDGAPIDHLHTCLASACMAWRWFDILSDDGTRCHHKPSAHFKRVAEPPEGRALAERRGFCGLAGVPQ